MTTPLALIDSDIPQLKLLSKGKVRDIYATSSPEHLLFVASDRISAYDVIMKNVNLPTHPPSIPVFHLYRLYTLTYLLFLT
jgi:hypothetical protein